MDILSSLIYAGLSGAKIFSQRVQQQANRVLIVCSQVSRVHSWSHAVTRGMWNNYMTALVNTFTRFTCQEDSGRAALEGRDDSSFPCFVFFAENRTIWRACSWGEREEPLFSKLWLDNAKRIFKHVLFDLLFRPADSISCLMIAF